jgi:hypothetical protein
MMEEDPCAGVKNRYILDPWGNQLELSAIPAKGLRLEAGVGYLDAYYKSVDPAATGITVALS